MALRTVVLLLAGDALTFLLASHVVDTNCLIAARRQLGRSIDTYRAVFEVLLFPNDIDCIS